MRKVLQQPARSQRRPASHRAEPEGNPDNRNTREFLQERPVASIDCSCDRVLQEAAFTAKLPGPDSAGAPATVLVIAVAQLGGVDQFRYAKKGCCNSLQGCHPLRSSGSPPGLHTLPYVRSGFSLNTIQYNPRVFRR